MSRIQEIPLNGQVNCDYCNEDYTNSTQHGGFLFGSNAVCPKCAPKMFADAVCYGELQMIRGKCPEGMSFKDWVISLRGGVDCIRIISADSPKDFENEVKKLQQPE